jgi:hypothetical protein
MSSTEMSSTEMSSTEDVLRETISKLSLDINLIPEDFTYFICVITRMIEYRKNEKLYRKDKAVNEVSGESISSNTFSEKTVETEKESSIIEHGSKKIVEADEESLIIEDGSEKTLKNEKESLIMDSPTTVTAKPSFKEILKKDLPPSNVDTSYTIVSSNSVTSTNSSRDSEQHYSIRGIADIDEEVIEKMKHNSEMNKNIEEIINKNKKIYNIDTLIKSLLYARIPMWKIMFYFYISNKDFDISSSISAEDARQNDKKFQILEDYTKNKLINFDDTHPYYEYIEYYFDKTIDYNRDNDFYSCKKDKSGNPIVLIFKNRFLKLINKYIMNY